MRRGVPDRLDLGQAVHQPLDRMVDGIERFPGAALAFRLAQAEIGKIAFELGRRDRVGAHFLDLQEQVGEPALDHLGIAEARIRRRDFLRQLGDLGFDLAERGRIALAEIDARELLAQRPDQGFQPRGHRLPGGGRLGVDLAAQRLEPLLDRRNGTVRRAVRSIFSASTRTSSASVASASPDATRFVMLRSSAIARSR